MLNRAIIFFILIILICLLLVDEFSKSYDSFYLQLILVLDSIALASYVFLEREKNGRLRRNKLKFTSLFIIGSIIVCYQPFIDLAFGFLEESNYNLFIQPNNILQTFLYSSIAVNSFLLGLSMYKSKVQVPKGITTAPVKGVNFKALKILNVVFFLLFLTQLDATFLNPTTYGSQREVSALRSYAMLLFDTTFIAIILHLILNVGRRSSFYEYLRQFGANIVFFVIYLILIMISGDRGPIIYLSLALLFGFIYLNDIKIKLIKIVVFTIIFSVILGAMATIRRSGNAGDLTSSLLLENRYYPESFSPLTKELASSILTVSTATYNVPLNYDHFYGLFMVQNFTLLVPGLNSFGNSLFAVQQMNFSSAKFLTYVSLGPNATWGIGTSAVADVYLDFGLLGIIIVFLSFGYFIKRLEVNVMGYKTKKFLPVALYLLYFSFSIYISRSNLVVPLTKLTYVSLFYFAVYKKKMKTIK